MIRVLVADDQALVRSGFMSILARADDLEVSGEAANGAEALTIAAAVRRSPRGRVGHRWPTAAVSRCVNR